MKKFRELLINSINEEIKGSTIERLNKVKEIFESEMIWKEKTLSNDLIQKRLQDWLQGLCSTVQIPFENHAIIAWYETTLGRPAKEPKRQYNNLTTESERWVENYWPQCAKTLFEILYK